MVPPDRREWGCTVAEHRVPLLRRYEDPEHSSNPKIRELVTVDRIETREDHRLGLFVAGQSFRGGACCLGAMSRRAYPLVLVRAAPTLTEAVPTLALGTLEKRHAVGRARPSQCAP